MYHFIYARVVIPNDMSISQEINVESQVREKNYMKVGRTRIVSSIVIFRITINNLKIIF